MPDATLPPESATPPMPQTEIDAGKTMALLSYIPIAFVGLIVAIISITQKTNAYSLYHAKQALTLYICWAAVALCCVPVCFICIGFPLLMAANLGGLVLCVLGIINSNGGQCKPLPILGKFADQWFGKIQKV